MASQEPPPPATTIGAIGDDLLREIFLRLPSLPSLVRASLTCRSFLHAVRSSPAFRRPFRSLHAPPLLGLFFDPDGPAIPTFAPLPRRSGPDLAAAVRGADFFLTRLPDADGAAPDWDWEILDCRAGRVLLLNRITDQIAAYDPLTGALDLLPPPPDEISDGFVGFFTYLDYLLLSSDEAPGSFRVLCSCHDESRGVRAAVLSSATREWQIFPWTEATTPQPEDDNVNKNWLHLGTLAAGSVYWTHTIQAYMLALDTATLRFSRIDLPPHLGGQGRTFRAGETKDGRLCIVRAVEFALTVWFWREDDDGGGGAERWLLHRMFPLQELAEVTEVSLEDDAGLKVVAIVDGVVYLSTYEKFIDADVRWWFLSFCIETGKLERLLQRRYDSHFHPYIMAWPPSLAQRRQTCGWIVDVRATDEVAAAGGPWTSAQLLLSLSRPASPWVTGGG